MKAGQLVTSEVAEFTSRILVNGVQREADTWSVDRDLTGDLPQQVAAVHGVMQATGTIEWNSPEDVADGARNPWNPSTGWVPERGDGVEIYVSDGVTEWTQFTGVINQTTGNINGGFRSTIVDRIDDLSVDITHQPLLGTMPPVVFDGSEGYRNIGLHPIYFIDYALRLSGFYATPPREPNTNLYVPLQGSQWPHYGFLRTAPATGLNKVAPWGLGRHNFQTTYGPAESRPMSDPTQVSLLVAPDSTGATDVYLDYGSRSHHIRLTVNSQRVAIAQKNGVEVCRVTLGDATIISLLAKNGRISLRTNTGTERSGTFTPSGQGMSAISINAGMNASIAGFQVAHPPTASHEHMSTRWEPTARFDTTSLYLAGVIAASPNIENRKALNLIKEINDALLAAMWIDEYGVMQWAQSDTLRNRTPVRTVTTLDDVFSLDWETGLLQSSSRVRVTGKEPRITRGRWRGVTLATGRKDSMKSRDEYEIFLEAESNTDWVMPSYDFLEVGGRTGIWGSYNNPAYSSVGLYFSRDGGDTELTGLNCSITTERLGHQKAIIKYTAGNWPSDVEGIIETSPNNTNLWPKNRSAPLPRIVGMGKTEWSDESVTVEGAGGQGPELVHDTGYWANRLASDSIQERIAEYLAAQTAVPQPVVRNVEISPDPRLQLADVITIQSDLLGVTLTALVTGVSEGTGSEGYYQTLDVRVLSANSTTLTYEAFQQGLPGTNLTYEQWQALGPIPQTYTEFNTEGD